MSFGSKLKALWSACFQKAAPQPAVERALHLSLAKRPLRRILEIGVGDGDRALGLIELAQKRHRNEEIHYIGIDLFEGRAADQPTGLSLKEAHCKLRGSNARVKLIPGDPFSALARSANSLTQIDVVLIAADVDALSLSRAWFYLPRMLAAEALILWADTAVKDDEDMDIMSSEPELREVSRQELSRLIGATGRRRAA